MSRVRIETALGEIDIEVFEAQAPASAVYFLSAVRVGRYDDSSFFRIVTVANQNAEEARKIEVVQGGLKHKREDLPPMIPHEATVMTGLRHLKGTVSLARFAPGAVYHSFFICLRDEPALDFGGARHPDGQGFAAFGDVAQGFDVVERIFARAEETEYLKNEIAIRRAAVLPV
ncbi:peptidylprolyl isomerase [Dongia deserti]|uniref:peptidylprolyl isomerase n=1 Tax=Dongia deserti TaxID=2268030 RepID=UPI000E64DF22|nr:peptidylprolyl isomerase [Dongia deserti]